MTVNRQQGAILMAVLAPFFPTQGVLWTGVHVILVQRWRQGRASMDSLFSGIGSFYLFGLPLCRSAISLNLLKTNSLRSPGQFSTAFVKLMLLLR